MPVKPEARAEGIGSGIQQSDASSLSSRFGLPGSEALGGRRPPLQD
jgi:hypothetical protein